MLFALVAENLQKSLIFLSGLWSQVIVNYANINKLKHKYSICLSKLFKVKHTNLLSRNISDKEKVQKY